MLNLLSNFAASQALLDQCNKAGFFGLRPWYFYLPDSRFDGCDIRKFKILGNAGSNNSDIPLVLLAIVDDLLRIAALVAIGFVIVGAIRMIVSQGNPEDTGRAQSSIINALIGLAVAIVSIAFVSFLGKQLGG